jgi:serine/threonine protein kinase
LQNILIQLMPPKDPWWVKIADFGLTKRLRDAFSQSITYCGTPAFMAPEMWGFPQRNTTLAPLQKAIKADIWAVGETLHLMLTGMSSFGENLEQLRRYAVGHTGFPWTAVALGVIDAETRTFVEQLMHPEGGERPSAAAVLLIYPFPHRPV